MKRLMSVLFFMIVVGCISLPVFAGSISDVSTRISTEYQGSSMVDQGILSFYNIGSMSNPTCVSVSLVGNSNTVRGTKTTYFYYSGYSQAKSYYVDHSYNNRSVSYTAY